MALDRETREILIGASLMALLALALVLYRNQIVH